MPELTEVSLATLLQGEGVYYQVISVDQVCDINLDMDPRFKECKFVFLSSPLLRDLNGKAGTDLLNRCIFLLEDAATIFPQVHIYPVYFCCTLRHVCVFKSRIR